MALRAHIAYGWYVIRHKWYVFIECCKLGIPWRGLVHDWHKLLPSEWFPYVYFFHNADGTKRQVRDKTGYYEPDSAFDRAWFLHQKRAFHHWQSWCFPDTNGALKVIPMPDAYRREMLADWRGAGRAQGTPDVRAWYLAHEDKMRLHPETREWVEKQLRCTS